MQIPGATLISASVKTNKDGVPVVRVVIDALAEIVDVGEMARLIGTNVTVVVAQPFVDYAEMVTAGAAANDDGID